MMGRRAIHPLETLITALLLLIPMRSTARVTTEQIRVLLLIKLVYRLRVIMLLEAILLKYHQMPEDERSFPFSAEEAVYDSGSGQRQAPAVQPPVSNPLRTAGGRI